MEKKVHIGKRLRLSDYNYSGTGAYFVTVCTEGRHPILSEIVPAKSELQQCVLRLSPLGHLVDAAIQEIPSHYSGVEVMNYIIMPNHVHLILHLSEEQGPKLGQIIQQLKGIITKRYGQSVWQAKYYDHVVRDEADYRIKYQYIENNPAKWAEDEYYSLP